MLGSDSPVSPRLGYSVLEALLVAGILATLAMIAMAIWRTQSDSARRAEMVREIMALEQAIRQAWSGQETYATVSTSAVINRRLPPPKMIIGADTATPSLRHALGGAVEVAPSNVAGYHGGAPILQANAAFRLVVHDLRAADCMALLAAVTDAHHVQTAAGQWHRGAGMPLDGARRRMLCAFNGHQTVSIHAA